jgi:hypothetical protein
MKVVAQEQKNYRKPSYRKQYLRGCQERVRVLEEIIVTQTHSRKSTFRLDLLGGLPALPAVASMPTLRHKALPFSDLRGRRVYARVERNRDPAVIGSPNLAIDFSSVELTSRKPYVLAQIAQTGLRHC